MTETILKNEALSLWLDTPNLKHFPEVVKNEHCDVLVVGGGIAGITTAYLLAIENVDVILIDAFEFMKLSTGNTTAKVTYQHDLIYRHILDKYDVETAKLYYQAQTEAMEMIERLVADNEIKCDMRKTYAMLFASDDEGIVKLRKEFEAYEKIGIKGNMVEDVPYGLPGKVGLKVDNQLAFDPVKYLSHLITELENRNIRMFEHSRAIDIKEQDGLKCIKLQSGIEITANRVVVATGFPFFDGSGQYFMRLAPYRSYLVSFPVEVVGDGMFITAAEPKYSIRFSETEGRKHLLIGGRGHKVGQEESAENSYRELIDFCQKYFHTGEPSHRWSAQDYESLDKIPYIGRISSKEQGIYVATGFRKWGMTSGTAAAILLRDTLLGKESKYQDLFAPDRGELRESLGKAMKENINVAKEMIKGKIASKKTELADIKLEKGGIIRHRGKRAGAYKDTNGKLFLVDATCTHLGCELMYNDAEHTYDCPCHGSRFRYDGSIIEGPATKPLKKLDE